MRKSVAYNLRGTVPLPIATRHWLYGLHVDPWDNLWVTDFGSHLVMQFDPNGTPQMALGVDGEPGSDEFHFNQPTHVCVAPFGNIFVTDGYGNSRIVKFRADGSRLLEWGKRGTARASFTLVFNRAWAQWTPLCRRPRK